MPGVPDLLREIHRLRIHAREMQAEIDRGPVALKAHRNKLAKLEAAFAEAQDTLKKLKVTTHEKEVSLKAANQQIAKYEKQTDEVTDMKQMEALSSIRSPRQGKGRRSRRRNPDCSWRNRRADRETAGSRAGGQKGEDGPGGVRDGSEGTANDRLAVELKSAQAQLADVEAEMPADMRPHYQRMVNAFGADSLAAIDRQDVCTLQYADHQPAIDRSPGRRVRLVPELRAGVVSDSDERSRLFDNFLLRAPISPARPRPSTF